MGERTTGSGDSLAEIIGWVLGNAREHAADRELRVASTFCKRLTPTVHRAQIGRWETGQTGISYHQVRQYEKVLGLHEGQLLAAIDDVVRSRTTTPRLPSLPPPLGEDWRDRVDDLLDKAWSDERMTGLEWRWLAAAIGSHDDVFLPRATWEHLLWRLTTEADLSVGVEYQLRDEAKACLAAHPRCARTVVGLVERVLTDPAARVYTESAVLLLHTPAPEAVDLVMRLLDEEVGETAHYTLLWLARLLARDGRTGAVQDADLVAHAVTVLEDETAGPRRRDAAALLLEAIPGPHADGAAEWLRRAGDHRLADVVERGRLLGERQLDSLLEEIEVRLAAALRTRGGLHPVLRTLLGMATTRSESDARGTALTILMLAPQGRVIGGTYAAALRYALEHGPEVVVDEALLVLSWLLSPQDVPTMLRLGLDPATDPSRAGQALSAVGNARESLAVATQGPRPQEIAQEVLSSACSLVRSGRPTPDPVVRGHLYALGMLGRFDLVEELRATLDVVGASGGEVDPLWVAGVRHWLDVPSWARPTRV